LFPLEVAQELNLPLDAKNVNRYGGIGTGHITAAFMDVRIEVDNDVTFLLYAGFSDAASGRSINCFTFSRLASMKFL
jgi:hypothetical protein